MKLGFGNLIESKYVGKPVRLVIGINEQNDLESVQVRVVEKKYVVDGISGSFHLTEVARKLKRRLTLDEVIDAFNIWSNTIGAGQIESDFVDSLRIASSVPDKEINFGN